MTIMEKLGLRKSVSLNLSILDNKLAVAGLIIIIAVIFLAVFAGVISPYSPDQVDINSILAPPSWSHLFGTDQLGRDILTRVIYGTRVSLIVGVSTTGLALAVGVVLGAIAGYVGGVADLVIMTFMDILLSFPSIVLIIGLMAILGPSLTNVILVISVTYVPQIVRLLRGTILSEKENLYVLAARSIGSKDRRILFRDVLPNSIAPTMVLATMMIAGAIITEAAVSFLGVGVPPPTPTWGGILSDGRDYLTTGVWWMSFFPGIAIIITVVAFNLFGDGLRDTLDPRLRRQRIISV